MRKPSVVRSIVVASCVALAAFGGAVVAGCTVTGHDPDLNKSTDAGSIGIGDASSDPSCDTPDACVEIRSAVNACKSAADCVAYADPSCTTSSACVSGYCSYTYVPAGGVTFDQVMGDCKQKVCDGKGGAHTVPLTSDAPIEVDGSCRTSSCDANGNVEEIPDDTNLPSAVSDCETPTCTNGTASEPPKAEGTLCSTNGGRYCNAGGTCKYCGALDAACDKPGPATATNDSEAAAYDVGALTNNDDPQAEKCGAFKAGGAAGADWYRYEGSTTTVLGVSPYENDPSGLVSSTVNVQFCIYMSCTTADFVCPSGTTAASSPSGHPGCCISGMNPGMDIRHVCSDASVWMSVQSTDATTCAAYDFTFHY